MQAIRRAHVIAIIVLAVASAGIAGGCGGGHLGGPLVTVEMRGGECANGPCGTTVILDRDGHVHSAAKPPNDLGTVSTDQLAALNAAIRLTDFAELKSHPFTGQCPTTFDGAEVVYEINTETGPERIASCEVDIDLGAPLFVAVANALGAYIPLPLT
jgi:hypothetical protein